MLSSSFQWMDLGYLCDVIVVVTGGSDTCITILSTFLRCSSSLKRLHVNAEPLENTAQDSQMVLLDGVSDSKMARECGVGKLFQNYRPDRKNINVVGPVYCDSDMTGDADDRKLVSIYYSHIWRVLLFISFMNGSGI